MKIGTGLANVEHFIRVCRYKGEVGKLNLMMILLLI